jgi:hypothetical protein
MPTPPRGLTSPRAQAVIAGFAAAALAIGGFQTGRYTAAFANKTAAISSQPPSQVVSRKDALIERQQDRIIIRDIATVPFSELYDVLKSAPREQLLAWARDLDRMPRGPRQRAAVNAYYKSLVQVDHRAAIDAVMRAENLNMREIALDAITKAAPESIWGDLAEMTTVLPYPKRGNTREDIIWNWSAVDPVAAAQFISDHPVQGEDGRLFSLMCNWGEINPEQAWEWLEADPSRQTEDAFRALVSGWADKDREAAIQFVLANALHAEFNKAIDELAYDFVRKAKDAATRLMLRLPPDKAKGALDHIAHISTGVILGLPDGYQRPPDEVARWMITLPVDLWNDAIGNVAEGWLKKDGASATSWLNQLQPDLHDAAIASLCRTAGSESVEQVLTLGETIIDRKLRDRALGQMARNLGETREESLKAVDELPISEEQKAYLRKVMVEERNGR